MEHALLDQVTQQFLYAFHQDARIIDQAARSLFYYLVIIQLSVTSLTLVLSGESLLKSAVRWIQLASLFGVFYALIDFGSEWVPQVLNGFIQLGQQGGITSLDPSSLIDQGIAIASSIVRGFLNWGLLGHPFVSFVGGIVCIVVVVIYALIAVELVMALVKAYCLVAMNGFFFALGAIQVTREMTVNYCRTVIGLGLQLMMLYLLLGVGQNLSVSWAAMTKTAAEQHELMPMFVILSAVIVYYFILKNLPSFVAGLAGVRGFRHEGGLVVGMAMSMGSKGHSALSQSPGKLMGAMQAGAGALKAAGHMGKSFQQGFQQGEGGWSGVGQGMASVAKHVSTATANTLKNKINGSGQAPSGLQKFNQQLSNQLRKNHSEKKD